MGQPLPWVKRESLKTLVSGRAEYNQIFHITEIAKAAYLVLSLT